ncbi:maleylpyruvate isomerase N-terminal domain-containing protein [Streptomyces sp. NBC_00557]|nr:maleylpyruvate isomerase N-terminal domain-containing protein [Streptomyces sp. NBC_00557]
MRAAAGLSHTGLRASSRLPGWTRGHVLAHVAHSVDAFVWLLRLARTGREPGPGADAAAPADALERDAALPVGRLAGRLRDSLDRFADQARTRPAPPGTAWSPRRPAGGIPPGTCCAVCGSWRRSTSAWASATAPNGGRKATSPGRWTTPSPPCAPGAFRSRRWRPWIPAGAGPWRPKAPRWRATGTRCPAGSAAAPRPPY